MVDTTALDHEYTHPRILVIAKEGVRIEETHLVIDHCLVTKVAGDSVPLILLASVTDKVNGLDVGVTTICGLATAASYSRKGCRLLLSSPQPYDVMVQHVLEPKIKWQSVHV